ncbi:MBL fold metallo-hydrolase [Desulfatitalea alkaliphila]|uniref:MBL fold metallo-hydrolase n=1 Tax=Desulfatitalea alkaliphila TaxID=2929485 RepID=A0AA41US67_9BACT|nr:MBL fold metallo-hydrolase [Desulfatitalea alkaliphila]MCJ8502993.1 MBL fold metallo-hydrolase [Desulfatitalea alkaliphila]
MKYPVVHLGGAACVTGSCHLVQLQGVNILVDCGLTQGDDRSCDVAAWPVKVAELDFIILTHAHVDHIGLLPRLVAEGFEGEILCSHPTKALLAPMLNDAMRFDAFSRAEREGIGRKIDELSWGFEYGQVFDLKRGLSFKLGRAGHILGSCFVRIESGRDDYSILFSGE